MSPSPDFREVYRNHQVFGSRAGYIAVRFLRTLLVIGLCLLLLAYGVHQIRTGQTGRNTKTAITFALMAIAAFGIPVWIAMERGALRRLDQARRYVAGGGRLAYAEGFPRWKLDRRNDTGHATLRSGTSTRDVSGGSFAVGDCSWDLDELGRWQHLYEATGRPGSAASLSAGGFTFGGRGGTAEHVVVRAWYVPDSKVLVGVEARPATPYDQFGS